MKLGVMLTAALIVALIVMPLMSAVIYDDTLRIKIYTTTQLSSDIMTVKIELRSTEDYHNNRNFTFDVNLKNGTVFASSILKDFSDIPYRVASDTTASKVCVSDWDNQTKCNRDLLTCQSSIAGYSNSYNVCNTLLGNQTKLNNLLNSYNASLIQKNVELTTKDNEISDLQTKSNDSKNTKWFFGLIGLAVGAAALNWYKGSKGIGRAKERSMGEFNREQAG